MFFKSFHQYNEFDDDDQQFWTLPHVHHLYLYLDYSLDSLLVGGSQDLKLTKKSTNVIDKQT